MKRLILIALVLAAPSHAGSDHLAPALDSFTADNIARHIKILASDEFEGRAPATPGEEKTIAYIRDQFVAAGVQPMPDGSYFQPVPLVSRRVLDDPVVTIQQPQGELRLPLESDALLGTALQVEHVSFGDLDLVFAGYGIVAPEYGWNDYEGLDVDGKVVMVLMNDPGRITGDEDLFKGTALTLYGTTSHKQEQAAARGARGLMLVHDEEIIHYPWSVVGNHSRKANFSSVPNQNTVAKPDLFVEIPRERADELLEVVGRDYASLLLEAAQPGFRGFVLEQSLSVDFNVELEYSTSHNVIGWVPGREQPDEFVLYTAHWDHVGVGTPKNGDSIHNGAVDNATGTAVLMELARAFAALPEPPARSVVFIATAAEEQGLLGAFHYTDNPVFPLAKTMAVINMDALFPFDDFNAMTVVAMGSSEIEDYLAAAAHAEGRVLEPDSQPEAGAFFRSDHYPFAKKGVPAIFTIGGPASDPPPSDKLIARYTDYITNHYHQPSDEYDPDTWDMRGIVGDARIYFRTGYAIAQDRRVPNWYLKSEFRALGDRLR